MFFGVKIKIPNIIEPQLIKRHRLQAIKNRNVTGNGVYFRVAIIPLNNDGSKSELLLQMLSDLYDQFTTTLYKPSLTVKSFALPLQALFQLKIMRLLELHSQSALGGQLQLFKLPFCLSVPMMIDCYMFTTSIIGK